MASSPSGGSSSARFVPYWGENPHSISTNGHGPQQPELDRPRRFGFAVGVVRTFRGPHTRTARGAISSAAGRGALAGHTAVTQPRDAGHEATQAASVARQRAARLARRAFERVQGSLSQYGDAVETIDALEPQRTETKESASKLRRVLERLERELIALERKLPTVKVPPPPSAATQAEWAEDLIPGYRLQLGIKSLLFASAASIEAVFAGSMISEIANIGQLALPTSLNTGLPWIAGGMIGAAIPFAAERAANAESRAPSGAPWYQRWVTTVVIAAPAALGVTRAAFIWDQDGRYAGLLALAIGVLMTALAMVGATIGRREREGELWDAGRRGRQLIREQVRKAQIPPPSPQERELMATIALRDSVAQECTRLDRRYDALGERIAEARAELGHARGSLHGAGEQSALDAEEQAGLGDSMQVTFVQRRSAQLARYLSGRPGSYEEKPIKPISAASLPQLDVEQLMRRVEADTEESCNA